MGHSTELLPDRHGQRLTFPFSLCSTTSDIDGYEIPGLDWLHQGRYFVYVYIRRYVKPDLIGKL